MRYHSRADARMTTTTMIMKNNASAASIRSLKIICAAAGFVEPASDCACERKPSFGSGENTFCQPAVSVADASQSYLYTSEYFPSAADSGGVVLGGDTQPITVQVTLTYEI